MAIMIVMNKLRENLDWIILSILLLIPVLFWFQTPSIEPHFNNIQNTFSSLGELTGIVGIILFSINLILTTRFSFVERLMGGLNNVYKKHSIIGQTGLMLILFHPLLLLARYASTLQEASSFLSFSSNWGRNFGLISLSLIVGLIVLTLYLRPKYNIWKFTHKFLGVAFFLIVLHVYLIPSYSLNNNAFLKYYIFTFASLGFLAFLYRTIFGKFLIKKYTYKVVDVMYPNDRTIKISLKRIGEKMRFKSGQFIFISFKQDGLSPEIHPFSISSAPNEELLNITVKKLGDFTNDLVDILKAGSTAKIEGPFGVFSYKNAKNKKQIWIAGGVGITPFISMAKDLIHSNDNYIIKLYYAVRNKNEAIYLGLLTEISKILNNRFTIIPFYSDEKGYINSDYIMANTKDISERDVFLCAPPQMVDMLKRDFLVRGICSEVIHSEEFDL